MKQALPFVLATALLVGAALPAIATTARTPQAPHQTASKPGQSDECGCDDKGPRHREPKGQDGTKEPKAGGHHRHHHHHAHPGTPKGPGAQPPAPGDHKAPAAPDAGQPPAAPAPAAPAPDAPAAP